MKIYTIGVYGSTEEEFFNKLVENRIDTFCDIRQRRGVRGSKYSFVNSNRLQSKLAELNIKYNHIIDLAPTIELRKMQYEDNLKQGEKKENHNQLDDEFSIVYKNEVMEKFNFDSFVKKLGKVGANHIVLFCVETNPETCHRSIVANELNKLYNFEIIHLL